MQAGFIFIQERYAEEFIHEWLRYQSKQKKYHFQSPLVKHIDSLLHPPIKMHVATRWNWFLNKIHSS